MSQHTINQKMECLYLNTRQNITYGSEKINYNMNFLQNKWMNKFGDYGDGLTLVEMFQWRNHVKTTRIQIVRDGSSLCSVSTGGDGLPVLATDHLVHVKVVGFAADTMLQVQLTADQNPLLLLRLDQSLLQSERMWRERGWRLYKRLFSVLFQLNTTPFPGVSLTWSS